MTIQEVIEKIQKRVPGEGSADTVDTIKSGDPTQPVRGIVVTFMATRAVLKQAVDLGANFIITHEPTYFNGRDETTWLEKDTVFRTKKRWIEDQGVTLWRFHDGLHALIPDGIDAGVAEKLGWRFDPKPERRKVFTVPAQTVRELAHTCKQRLGISQVRVAGDLDAICTTAGLLVGAWGGKIQIELFRDHGVDVVVCGESPEWETCEYVRDAVEMGQKKALIVLGHANSEEAGMEWMARWLRLMVPEKIPIHYVAAGDPFQFI